MSTESNGQWRLARTPTGGWPVDEDFRWVEDRIPVPADDQMLTRTIYLSMDPYQWGRRRGGVEQPGDVCHGRTVAEVIEIKLAGYRAGDIVFNTNGWQMYGLTGEGISNFGYMFPRKLDPTIAPVSTAIGVLGMLGLTAYSGLMVQCEPRPGETVVVSAASGGVGQVACQLAKIAGCRVVGIAGAERKVEYLLDELGVDACVSHASASFAEDLTGACPDGCDVYFENVGGKVYEGVLQILNPGARITVCGMISQYGNTDGKNAREAWDALGAPVFERQKVAVHDLFVGNFVADHQDRFLDEMAGYIRDGLVRYKEDRFDGLQSAPTAFRTMLEGGNFGKTIVVVGDEPSAPAATDGDARSA